MKPFTNNQFEARRIVIEKQIREAFIEALESYDSKAWHSVATAYLAGAETLRDVLVNSLPSAPEDGAMVVLPRELTAENGAKYLLIGEFFTPDNRGNEVVVSWTAIKEIYAKIVDHYGSPPPPTVPVGSTGREKCDCGMVVGYCQKPGFCIHLDIPLPTQLKERSDAESPQLTENEDA